LARPRGLPVIVVGDIDRGGVFAALYGTVALLEPADQALISGFVINKFRGDQSLLTPGLAELTARTGRPVLGVVPYLTGRGSTPRTPWRPGASTGQRTRPAAIGPCR
jgi:adenosylcobyric acid synthase